MISSENTHSHFMPSWFASSLFWKQPNFWIGTGIALAGLTLRGRTRVALLGTGSAIATFEVTRKRMFCSHGSVLIQCAPEEAYQFWRDFQNLPRFMGHVQSVQLWEDGRSHWTLTSGDGKQIDADVEMVVDRANSSIAWRSTPNCNVKVDGKVEFQAAVSGRGTIVSASLHYPVSTVGFRHRLVRMFERVPTFLATQDLRRFKALLETGEIATTEGQPHGPRSAVIGAMRHLSPDQPSPSTRSKLIGSAEQRRIA